MTLICKIPSYSTFPEALEKITQLDHNITYQNDGFFYEFFMSDDAPLTDLHKNHLTNIIKGIAEIY